MDAYSAAAIKVGPCSLSGSRVGNYGGQVILPLAHTIDHEEVKICAKNSIKYYEFNNCVGSNFLLTYASFWKSLNWKELLILLKTQ